MAMTDGPDLAAIAQRQQAAAEMTRDEMQQVFDVHAPLEAYDFDGVLTTMTADCYQLMPSIGLRLSGPAAVRGFYASLFGAFPDLGGELSTRTAWDRNTMVRWGTFGGTMTGSYFGFEPTGRRFDVLRFTVLEFRDGLVVGEITYFDADTFCSQLGLPVSGVRAAADRVSQHGW